MEPGSDWLANIFLFTFLFGLVFTVVSVFMGATHLGGAEAGHDVQADFGHDIGHDVGHGVGHDASHDIGHGDGGAGGPSVLNMPTIMAFLTWFGGAGYIFTRTLGLGALLTVPMALLSGLFGGAIMFALLAKVLWPMMSKPMASADFKLPGTAARVVSSIREGGVGEIVYSKGGSRFTAGARAVDGASVPKGSEVVILKYERGLAHVQRIDDLLDSEFERSSGEDESQAEEVAVAEKS
jgi:hypothetical protein